ncbi:MAG TPA: response regulator [Thermoanaerobaculia bacterium]|nr:response regulator [Thermoanaerobaculia bacterium]
MSPIAQRSVLVADGDAAIRSLLAAVVQRMNLRPVMARDANAARELLATSDFEAAVIDLLLPDTASGEQVVDYLAQEKPELVAKTIVMTTLPVKQVHNCHGVAAVLRKPFALDDLTAALRRCCET